MRFVLAILIGAGIAAAQNQGCPVTQPPRPAFVPPAPYPKSVNGGFYYGTPKLWVYVFNSPWRGPVWDIGIREKVSWWAEGYDSHRNPPPLIITGRRIDGESAPLIARANWSNLNDGTSFIMSGVNFPKPGCWEITGLLNGAETKFVVKVE